MTRSPHPRTSAVALVIVLSFLALITVLVLAFFSSISTELSASGSAADGVAAKQLADSAVNIVMTQLVDGTKGLDSTGATLAWASQPGMLRTYTANGDEAYNYKLYSSEHMVVDGQNFKLDTERPPHDWNSPTNTEVFTDLNAPGVDSQGNLIFPIIDPFADGTLPRVSKSTTPPSGSADKLKVDGFSITSSPGYDPKSDDGVGNNKAPMPVHWLYLLQDGTLVPGTSNGTKSASVPGAARDNPIVGRIAFWTDDETAKVNINTASEGTYWDMPRIYSAEDMGGYIGSGTIPQYPSLAICQPFQHEYQRYPGHPATTSLSPVLGSLLPVAFPYPANPSASIAAQLDPYYHLAPRVGLPASMGGGSGGSKGGTAQDPAAGGNAALTTDGDRLYASVDELMFTPALAAGAAGSIGRVPNTAPASSTVPRTLSKATLEKARFFLTANSNAPEITLFNTPRVAIWPVWDNSSDSNPKRTPFDELMAFCSAITPATNPSNRYYFTRLNSRSMTADFSGRNADLYRYLQKLTAANIPGFGGNFLQKYPAGPSRVTDRDQILTFIYDYIRCTSIQDKSTGSTPYSRSTAGVPVVFEAGQVPGAGEVMPIRIDQTQGFGRFYSISQANLLFYGTHQVPGATSGKASAMRALLFFEFASPAQGLGCMRASVKYRVTGLKNFQVVIGKGDPQSLNFPDIDATHDLINDLAVSDLSTYHGRSIGGSESPNQGLLKKSYWDANFPPKPIPVEPLYQFLSKTETPIPDQNANTFKLKENPGVLVEILNADNPNDLQVIQTIHLHFPPGEFLLPKYGGGVPPYDYLSQVNGTTSAIINGNNTVLGLQVAGVLDTSTDTNTSNPTAGDTRMVEGLRDVPQNRFHACKEYFVKGTQFGHSTVMSVGETYVGAKYGKLVDVPEPGYFSVSAGYSTFHRQPDVPSRVGNAVYHVNPRSPRFPSGPGDWDTGMGDQKDGAYINKPDEGDSALRDGQGGVIRIPYNLGYGQGYASANQTYFSPNRQVPSPMMFGSIPTGVQRMHPWQTLLFHPRPEDQTHPGLLAPRDELLADLFWMPVIEPYAISQPFSTAGKINMNYQIMPFDYITRQTGLYAVMKATKFAAIPATDCPTYKPIDPSARTNKFNANRRHAINIPRTLLAFDKVFANGNLFKSATQICEIDLWPADSTPLSMQKFWQDHTLTGDNLREKPYVDLYPRLTTKSNTFTVHVRVQALRKSPNTPVDQWIAARDQVVSEYRGSSILERYIDVNDPALPDFATNFDPANPKGLSIDQYYKMRVISTKRFLP